MQNSNNNDAGREREIASKVMGQGIAPDIRTMSDRQLCHFANMSKANYDLARAELDIRLTLTLEEAFARNATHIADIEASYRDGRLS